MHLCTHVQALFQICMSKYQVCLLSFALSNSIYKSRNTAFHHSHNHVLCECCDMNLRLCVGGGGSGSVHVSEFE